MGVEIRPIFQPPVRGLVYEAEGKVLAQQIQRLHTFCIKQGIRPITDFLPQDDMDEDGDMPDVVPASSDWHSPADGVTAVRALRNAIAADPKAAERWNKRDPDGLETLLNDLDALASCLEAAATHGVQFRLDIG